MKVSVLASVFLGTPGSYDINGIQVSFEKGEFDLGVFGKDWFGRTVDICLNNSAVQLLTLGYLHVFIHEMGHALAAKLHGNNPIIKVYIQTCQGITKNCDNSKFTALAGPLAGMSLEVVKLVGAIALGTLCSPAIGLPLGIFIGSGAVFWLFGEIMYALTGEGDWAKI